MHWRGGGSGALGDQLLEPVVQHLAHGVARQAVDQHVFARHFVAGELLQAESLDLDGTGGGARAEDEVGDGHLLPSGVGAADHRRLCHGRMGVQHALHLGWIDVLAAGDDQVLLAVVDEEMPVGVARAEIFAVIPALAERFGRRRRVAPIFDKHVGAAHHHLAGGADRHLAPGVVDDPGLASEPRKAGRTRPPPIPRQPRVDGDRAGLGRPVHLQHRHATRREGVDQALRHLRGAGRHRPQAVEPRRLPARVVEQGLDGGRHQHRQRGPVALDRLECCLGSEAGVQRDGGAQLQRRRGLDVEPADVEQRQHGQHVVLRRHVVHVLAHHRVAHQRLLAQHGALRAAGGAGGVDDEQRGGRVDMRVAAVAAGALEQRRQRGAMRGRIVEADDARSWQGRLERLDHRRQGLLDDQYLHRGVAQDVDLLRHREPPVERHQQGAEPGAGIEQHQDVRVVGRENGDPVARTHPQLRFQRARGLIDAPGETGKGQRRAGKADRRLVGREGRVALDEIGQVHLGVRPSSCGGDRMSSD